MKNLFKCCNAEESFIDQGPVVIKRNFSPNVKTGIEKFGLSGEFNFTYNFIIYYYTIKVTISEIKSFFFQVK